MILLQIDPDRILLIPFECDAPWTIDVNGVAHRLAPKPMEIESRQVERLWSICSIECVEA